MPPQQPNQPPTLMHNLGAFFGEIAKAIKTDPTKPPPARTAQISATHTSQQVQTQLGPATATTRTVDELQVSAPHPNKPQQITARRTTVEEVTVIAPLPGGEGPGAGFSGSSQSSK